MNGHDLAIIAAFGCVYMGFRILQKHGFGPSVRYDLGNVIFWILAAIVLLIASGAPAVRSYCWGC